MKEEVKAIQRQYGEEDFLWTKSTEEIIAITIHSLKRFMHDEQLKHLKEQLPKDLQELVA